MEGRVLTVVLLLCVAATFATMSATALSTGACFGYGVLSAWALGSVALLVIEEGTDHDH